MNQSHLRYNVNYLLPGKQEDMQTVGLHLQSVSRMKRVMYLHKD